MPSPRWCVKTRWRRKPGLEECLTPSPAQLNNDVITELNKKVDIDHQSPQQVARDFLRGKKLL